MGSVPDFDRRTACSLLDLKHLGDSKVAVVHAGDFLNTIDFDL
jgi:hypothetical protein